MSYGDEVRFPSWDENLTISLGDIRISHKGLNSRPSQKEVKSFSFPYAFSRKEQLLLRTEFSRVSRIEDLNLEFLEEPKRSDFYRFKYLLLFYKEKVKNPIFSAEEVLERSMTDGPAFAEELSDFYKYSVRRSISIHPWESYEEYPMIREDINEVFPYQCLLQFANPDPQDYKLMLEPPPIGKGSLEQAFREEFLEVLKSCPSYLNMRDTLDDFDFFRNSKSFNPELHKAVKNYDHFMNQGFTKRKPDHLWFKRCFVHKLPGESRDALEATPETLEILLPCFKYMSEIFKSIPEYKMKKGFDPYHELAKLRRKIFVMVDMKKCGLTFPRNLFLIMMDTLYETYPIEEFKTVLELYKKNPRIILDDGSIFPMTNGVGLGMFNELVTVGLLVSYKLAVRKGILPKNSTGWFFNDDQLVYWDDDSLEWDPSYKFEEYINILRKLGFKVHQNKPLVSKVGIFCEQYTRNCPFYTEKSIKQMHILLSSVLSTDIFSAKTNFSNHYKKWWGLTQEDNDFALSIVSAFWGYEFSPKEIYLPYEYGGWIKLVDKGLNPYLQYLEDSNIKEPYKKLLLRYKPPVIKYKPWRKPPKFAKFLASLKVENQGVGFYDWNTRIEQILLRDVKASRKEDSLDLIRKKKILERRAQAFASKKCITNDEIYRYINSNLFNNVEVPSFIVKSGQGTLNMRYLPKLEKPVKTDDPVRLAYFMQTEGNYVRPPNNGVPSDILLSYLNNYKRAYGTDRLRNGLMFVSILPKLIRFGSNVSLIFKNLEERFPDLVDLQSEAEPSIVKTIERITHKTLQRGFICIPYWNNIFVVPRSIFKDRSYGIDLNIEKDNFELDLFNYLATDDIKRSGIDPKLFGKTVKEDTQEYWENIFEEMSRRVYKKTYEEILEGNVKNYQPSDIGPSGLKSQEELDRIQREYQIMMRSVCQQTLYLLPDHMRQNIPKEIEAQDSRSLGYSLVNEEDWLEEDFDLGECLFDG